eukprot:5520602-Alexandrium_andersonii.AAC.1
MCIRDRPRAGLHRAGAAHRPRRPIPWRRAGAARGWCLRSSHRQWRRVMSGNQRHPRLWTG